MAGPWLFRFMKPQLLFLELAGAGVPDGCLMGIIVSGGLSKSGASPSLRVVVRGVLSIGDK